MDYDDIGLVETALADGSLRIWYQPVMEAGFPGRVLFHEALLRIMVPGRGAIPAARFVPQLEAGEIGRRLDLAALEAALSALRCHPGLVLSVNVAASSLGDPRWRSCLGGALDASPALAGRLIPEVTERAPALVAANAVRALRRRGVRMALDDFGAGFADAQAVNSRLFDIIKIDGALVRGVGDCPETQARLRQMINLARGTGALVVAEWVETEADALWLTREGVDGLQGYLFSRPGPVPWTTALPLAS